MDETLNIILDSEQIIFKKTTRLQRAIQKTLASVQLVGSSVVSPR